MNGFPVVAPSDCQLDSSAERVEVRLSGWSRPGIQCDDVAVRFLHLKNKRPRFARLPQSIRSSWVFPGLSKKKKRPQKSVLPFAYRLISSLTSCFFPLSLRTVFKTAQPSTRWAALDDPSGPSACKHQVESRLRFSGPSCLSLISLISAARLSQALSPAASPLVQVRPTRRRLFTWEPSRSACREEAERPSERPLRAKPSTTPFQKCGSAANRGRLSSVPMTKRRLFEKIAAEIGVASGISSIFFSPVFFFLGSLCSASPRGVSEDMDAHASR